MLYKYLDPNGVKSIECGYLFASHADDFNDPFEWKIVVDREQTAKILELERISKPKEQEEYRRSLNDPAPATMLTEKKIEFACRALEADIFPKIDVLKKRAAITCFSTIRDSIQMWAHYADKNTGFVIGYDEYSINPERDFFRPVQYISSPVKIAIGLVEDQESINRYINQKFLEAIISKHISWAYEHEVRATICADEAIDNATRKHKLQIPGNAIKEIIFGYKTQPKTKEAIKKALAEAKIGGIKFYNAELNKSEYKIDILEDPEQG